MSKSKSKSNLNPTLEPTACDITDGNTANKDSKEKTCKKKEAVVYDLSVLQLRQAWPQPAKMHTVRASLLLWP